MTLLALRQLVARARCAFTGHTRGVRLDAQRCQCRRCGAEWDRPQRKPKAQAE